MERLLNVLRPEHLELLPCDQPRCRVVPCLRVPVGLARRNEAGRRNVFLFSREICGIIIDTKLKPYAIGLGGKGL